MIVNTHNLPILHTDALHPHKITYQQHQTLILNNKYQYLCHYKRHSQELCHQLHQQHQILQKQLEQLKELPKRHLTLQDLNVSTSSSLKLHSSRITNHQSLMMRLRKQAEEEIACRTKFYQEEERKKQEQLEILKNDIAECKRLCEIHANKTKEQLEMELSTARTSNNQRRKQFTNIVDFKMKSESFGSSIDKENQRNQNRSATKTSQMKKSFKKIKTKIVCEVCQKEYKPNEYYQHLDSCHQKMKSIIYKQQGNVLRKTSSSSCSVRKAKSRMF